MHDQVEGLTDTAEGDLPPALLEGVRLFNERAFFECHEVLEDAWRAETGPLRDLYQGLIKAAVAFYHAERGNPNGALKVMRSGLPQLRPYRTWRGLDLEALVPELEGWLEAFERLKREGGAPDRGELPLIRAH